MRDVFRQQMSHRCSRANFARKETSFCDPLLMLRVVAEREGEGEEVVVGVSSVLCGLFAFDHTPDCAPQGACK